MRRFRHGAGIGEQAAGPGGGDADGVGELDRRRARAGARPPPRRRAGLAAPGGWNRILRASNCPDACRIQPCISTPLTSAVSIVAAAQRPALPPAPARRRAWWTSAWFGRAPHRLEVEHVHGRAVERRCRNRVEPEAIADRGRLSRRRPAPSQCAARIADRLFLGAGDGDGDAVEHQPPRAAAIAGAPRLAVAGAGNLFHTAATYDTDTFAWPGQLRAVTWRFAPRGDRQTTLADLLRSVAAEAGAHTLVCCEEKPLSCGDRNKDGRDCQSNGGRSDGRKGCAAMTPTR